MQQIFLSDLTTSSAGTGDILPVVIQSVAPGNPFCNARPKVERTVVTIRLVDRNVNVLVCSLCPSAAQNNRRQVET
jgi:hypothetical protein